MANIGHFIERNAGMRAAGLPSLVSDSNTGECMMIAHPEEKAEFMIRTECKNRRMRNAGLLLKRTPCMPEGCVGDLLSTDLSKSRFQAFKEKFSEDMFFKKAKVGEIKPTYSKPDEVTNVSFTFGCGKHSCDPIYPIILPPKSAEQVNREYAEFHEKHIISHSHYFPGEQINRKYKPPFNRFDTFGNYINEIDTGLKTKQCMQQCDRLIIVSKSQMDFMDRTRGRLGKKYKKYPYTVPKDMTHGVPTHTVECDGKMLIEDISPCVDKKSLVEAVAHLNKWRHKLQKRLHFHMFDLLSVLEKNDKDHTGFLPLDRIFEIMRKMHIRVDAEKMRTAVAHFNMLVDQGCPTERVNYEEFCKLLTIQVALPRTGNISIMPTNVYNKDTTYRLLCADLKKKPIDAPPQKQITKSPEEYDNDLTHVVDLVSPEIATLYGLGQSDFERPRNKETLERIFKELLDANSFENAWQALQAAHQGLQEFSVKQFYELLQQKEPGK